MTTLHKYNEWLIVGAVSLHVVAVAMYQWGLKVDLVRPMLHGWKHVPAELRRVEPARASNALAIVIALIAAALIYWLVAIYAGG